MNTDPTTPRHEAIIGALSRDVEMLKREKLAKISNDWVYWGSYPTDPHTTVDSPAWTNSWGNTGGAPTPTEPTRFRLTPDGNLEIEGSFEGGISGHAIGIFPVAWRPDYPKVFVIVTVDHVVLALQVDTDGTATPYTVLVTGPTGATGTAGANGTDGLTILNGAGAPSSGTGTDGDFYIDTTAHAIYGPKTSGAWGASTSLIGPAGTSGTSGASAGLKYTYSNNTANSDPTSGKLKFDSATLSAITALRISETDGDGNSIAALIQSWDDSTSAVRATVTIVKDGAPSNLLVFEITGTITDNGTWDSCSITYIASSGSFTNGDTVRVLVSRTGDPGAAGTNGTGGIKYIYSTNTANSDPTTGKLKFDTTTLSAIATLRISETDDESNAIAALLQTLDDSTSTVRATVTIVKDGAPSNIIVFKISGPITDNGTWDSCGITPVVNTGSFADGDIVRLFFSLTGDKGDTGTAGAAGSLGGDSLFMWLHAR